MWTDRKPDNSPSARSSALSTPPDAAFTPAASTSGVTVIGRDMTIKGSIRSNESLHIDGEVDGSLELPDHRLTVGLHGKVVADARVREVEVLGRLDGDIDAAKKITIRKGGRLTGDLRTPAIVIEDGAYFKGRIEILNNEQRPQIVRTQQNGRKAAGA
jgi:cytoskeletal protein CcmA (bactofilin family)